MLKANIIPEMRESMRSHVGQPIFIVCVNGSKKIPQSGLLKEVSEFVFVVKLNSGPNVSYSYSDVYSNCVKVSFGSNNSESGNNVNGG